MKNYFQLYRRHSSALVLVSILIGMGLLAWFGIVPLQRLITKKADGIQEYHAFRENRERQIGRLPELEREWLNIVENEQTLDILLSQKEIIDFVKTLEGLAERERVTIAIKSKTGDGVVDKSLVQPAGKSKGPSASSESAKNSRTALLDALPYHRYLNVSVVVIGEYRNIIAFLHHMETLPLALDVIGFDVRKRNEDEIESIPSTPDDGNRNPFLMFDQGSSASTESIGTVPDAVQGPLEASFDMIVYISE